MRDRQTAMCASDPVSHRVTCFFLTAICNTVLSLPGALVLYYVRGTARRGGKPRWTIGGDHDDIQGRVIHSEPRRLSSMAPSPALMTKSDSTSPLHLTKLNGTKSCPYD